MRRPSIAVLLNTAGAILFPLMMANGAAPALPKADVFFTSFESNETPAYLPGESVERMGWEKSKSFTADAMQVVTGGSENGPAAPDGSQMLKLASIRNPRVEAASDGNVSGPIVSFRFSEEPLLGKVYFSGITAFAGTLVGETGIISRIYLNNAAKNESWLGVAFGIWQKEGASQFFYTKAPSGNAATLGEAIAQEGKFYRFEVEVDVTEKSYAIRVYDLADNSLLASAEDGKFRSGIGIGLSNLRLQNQSDPTANGDNFVTYYDQLWISTQPIPQP